MAWRAYQALIMSLLREGRIGQSRAAELLGRVDVLHRLFGKLPAPDAVMREVVTGGSGRSSYSARSSLRGRGETSVLDSFRFW